MQSCSRDSDTPALDCDRCGESWPIDAESCPRCGKLPSGLRFLRLAEGRQGAASANASDAPWLEEVASAGDPAESLARDTLDHASDAASHISAWIAPAVTLGAFVAVFGGYVAIAELRKSGLGPQDDLASALPRMVVGMSWVPSEPVITLPPRAAASPPSAGAPSPRFSHAPIGTPEARQPPSSLARAQPKPLLAKAANRPRKGDTYAKPGVNCGRYAQPACPAGSVAKATKEGIRAAVTQSAAARHVHEPAFTTANAGTLTGAQTEQSRLYRQH